jgi:hypothetical protein
VTRSAVGSSEDFRAPGYSGCDDQQSDGLPVPVGRPAAHDQSESTLQPRAGRLYPRATGRADSDRRRHVRGHCQLCTE